VTTAPNQQDDADYQVKQFTLELKAVEGEEGVIEGYGAYLGNQDRVGDVIEKGAFRKAIQKHNSGAMSVKMLYQHDYRKPIGVWNQMREDEKGLFVKGKIITGSHDGANAYALAKGGAIDGLSIGFVPLKWRIDSKSQVRTIEEIELYEISLVTFPANEKARIQSVKSDQLPKTVREFEKFLRDAGYSQSESKRISLYGFEQKKQRDAGLKNALSSLDQVLNTVKSSISNKQ